MILVLKTSCWSQTWSPGWSTIDRTGRMAAGRVPSDKKEPEVSMSGWVFYCASENSGDIRIALRLNVAVSRKVRFWGLDVGILVPVAAGARRCKKKTSDLFKDHQFQESTSHKKKTNTNLQRNKTSILFSKENRPKIPVPRSNIRPFHCPTGPGRRRLPESPATPCDGIPVAG